MPSIGHQYDNARIVPFLIQIKNGINKNPSIDVDIAFLIISAERRPPLDSPKVHRTDRSYAIHIHCNPAILTSPNLSGCPFCIFSVRKMDVKVVFSQYSNYSKCVTTMRILKCVIPYSQIDCLFFITKYASPFYFTLYKSTFKYVFYFRPFFGKTGVPPF